MDRARRPSISGFHASRENHFEVGAGLLGPVRQNLDGGDIALVLRDHAGQLVQYAGGADRVHHQPDSLVLHELSV